MASADFFQDTTWFIYLFWMITIFSKCIFLWLCIHQLVSIVAIVEQICSTKFLIYVSYLAIIVIYIRRNSLHNWIIVIQWVGVCYHSYFLLKCTSTYKLLFMWNVCGVKSWYIIMWFNIWYTETSFLFFNCYNLLNYNLLIINIYIENSRLQNYIISRINHL